MWTHEEKGKFDAEVWRGPGDLRTATVRLGMVAGLGLLWLAFIAGLLHFT
jgi:hypothetical protein